MIVTYRYRLLPTKRQHRALEQILESQRQLYNAALEERIDAYRKAGVTRTLIDETMALTEWRQSDPDASALPGARLIVVDPRNTSQDCSGCGMKVAKACRRKPRIGYSASSRAHYAKLSHYLGFILPPCRTYYSRPRSPTPSA